MISHASFMPTAAPPSRDVALETRFFWERFKTPIIVAAVVVLLAGTAFTGYRFYSDRRAAAASAVLASANTAQEYEGGGSRFAVFLFYAEPRGAAPSTVLASANTAKEYEEVITRYANTPAAADAYIL